ncbi:aspartate 1-decarboxylase [Candidatus Ruthia magnifica str. Cm (Calyptogena magnifica)]|uniref:Aspartate 1-decarboxylase n=1 Tax=Ruthia magnifica subsp. Calyptogena magnifica TaxID=413404 RepID=PAND_RUTMC|nr:aspartate 1-decarboxylase [Candidatus Ruthturnera calyptogenae]A1AXA6.1 RecName: Full=Aspartate 1-decarboxylase; AltName: Full=Aspartate alpha-decarboxylase; Contains: RecName: Full=Aspartate 1-decarboxylase beta chain; Contains: RecName: Full=Aspartate 1-decarboxylase alpha chain; Flags: Precursor [Candidatus Ruthia magnifica str. Cm (Calyptogena magnifica)]ABL02563.1 aspartate 1-decarboxylase [Candidatus Ruthia magnifica str. Cm (Calyptogena magnifica)]
MKRTFLSAKLHKVITTAVELDYEGSCEIDGVLLDAADIGAFEQIQIYNINNGNRFTTYTIRGKDNSGVISVNGAAAHKVNVGDMLIIAAYGVYSEKELESYTPRLCYVNDQNILTKISS